jgi:hypothetical protein
MFNGIIGAELRENGRVYSPCGIAISDASDFITDDQYVIGTYNTDVFCEIGQAVIPVYSNLKDIPADRLPNRLTIKVTDEAYPKKARWINTNFRVKLLSGASEQVSEYTFYNPYETSIEEPVGILPALIPFIPLIIKVAAILVTALILTACICTIFSSILAFSLPGGVSGAERQITGTKKLITYPDGSWDVYDTTTGGTTQSGAKPESWVSNFFMLMVLGVVGVVGVILFFKYGVPYIKKTMAAPAPKKPAPTPVSIPT